MVVGATLFMLIWINLDSIFYFMPEVYAAGRFVFLLIGIGKLFEMTTGLSSTIIITSKKYRYDLMFMAGMLVFALASNLVFIPLWGMEGAAFASLLTLVCFNLVRLLFIKHHFKMHPFKARQVAVPLLLAAIMLLSGMLPQMKSVYIDLPVRSALGLMLFVIPLKILNISPELNEWVIQIYRRVQKVF